MLKQHRNRQAGFTMVEVMMAATILVVGFIGMIEAITIGSEMLDVSRKQVIAAEIIQAEVAKLRLSSWTTVTGLPTGTTTITIDAALVAATGIANSNFTCTRTISTVRTDLRQITFTVTWTKKANSASSSTRTYVRSSDVYIGRNGLSLTYQRS